MLESYAWQDQRLPFYHFSELASTNNTAWELHQQGTPPPFAVISDRQTAGKGQWGRHWESQRGGLYLSLLLASEISLSQPSHLAISSVFGVTELLSCYQIPVQIKWLNDIFLQGKKLGGVLIETQVQRGRFKAVVIGIGVNWSNVVPDRGIALKDYLEQRGLQPKLHPSSVLLNTALKPFSLPPTLASLADLTYIVLAGLLLGYHCYLQKGITALIPYYEARLLKE